MNALRLLLTIAAAIMLSAPGTHSREVQRVAKDTLTPIELDWGDELHFKLRNGETRKLRLVKTAARIVEGEKLKVKKYSFTASFELDGEKLEIERVVPAQESFYEPTLVRGMRVWLDAVSDVFASDGGFLMEKDEAIGIPCQPKRKARLVVNDARDRICPEELVWWYPQKGERIDVRDCYQGEDVWMGPYAGRLAHGGLDINMKSGTPLTAPIRFDDQFYFNSLAAGHNNNRWRGIRRWADGSVWWLQAHHINKLLIPEHTPLARGTIYAETAGVHIGAREHTHFAWRISEEGEDYWIDPWIFFWQTFQDHKSTNAVAAPSKGQRVFTAGHSLLLYMPPILSDIAAKAAVEGHVQAGTQGIGGSHVFQHWNLRDDKNKVKPALRAGTVDVLTLSPIYLPDDGIEKLAALGLEHNANLRITVQEFWVPYDDPTVLEAGRGPKQVDRDSKTMEQLRALHAAYFRSMNDHVRALNAKFGKQAVFIVPVGQAVLGLREKIIEGKAPGIARQSDLFSDALGHAKPSVRVLSTYCHFAVIYRRSPIGLPVPAALNGQPESDQLNRLLQELAWNAVTSHPLSGVKPSR